MERPRASQQDDQSGRSENSNNTKSNKMLFVPLALVITLTGVLVSVYGNQTVGTIEMPAQAQFISQRAFNTIPNVLPVTESNASTFFIPPGYTSESLKERPFHVFDDEFLSIIGPNPSLTLIATSDTDPIFHEAVVWYPPTNEVFFVQSAGPPEAGTGLEKSSIVQKISLPEAQLAAQQNETGTVAVQVVDSNPMVINPNGGHIYKGNILFAGEGQGANVAPELIIMNPREPYNTTVLVNNFFGRQFNSLNDISINPRNKDVYFTDPLYGYLQDFRPRPGLPCQVYRYSESTGAITVAADGFNEPNGLTFSPDGTYVYIADTGAQGAFWGWNLTSPASIYRYDVKEDGTFDNRKLFAFVDSGVPDGVHVDTKGNVYAGCGDGVTVWNPSGKLLGKIYLGEVSANFNFAGDGGMVICAETNLYYATIAATGGTYFEV